MRLVALPCALALLPLLATDGLPRGPARKPDADKIDALIRQLGDDSFDQREAASEGLAAIGAPAL